MKTREHEWRKGWLGTAAWGCVLAGGLVGAGLAIAQEADLTEVLRSAQVGALREIASPATGPTIITTTNVLQTVLEEGDVLELQVVNEPILSMERAEIEKGGAIHHPLLRELKVAGKTLEQAERMIHEILLADYLVDPRVRLRIVNYAPYEFSVTGEVRNPSTISMPRNREIDVAQAIILAGGPTRIGTSRAQVERTVRGEQETIRVDLRPGRGDPVKVRHGDRIRLAERWF